MEMIDIFIPSYHRPNSLKTVKYFHKLGYEMKKIHVVCDDEADDFDEYKKTQEKFGFNLHQFNMEEARPRFDFVHRKSISRRAAGMSRNMFYDIAKGLGIDFFVMMDDDTTAFQVRPFSLYKGTANLEIILKVFNGVREMMKKRKIGIFGLSQTGDLFASVWVKILRTKVMNTTFINTDFIYRGERGVQDDDTSQFVSVYNSGLFTGSLATGLILAQTSSATQKGGLTDLYNECKLLNKALVTVIQFPSAICAEKQKKNGGRIHHKINYRYLMPKIIKGERSNIEWDTYKEDYPFTNEPKRAKKWD